MSLTAWRIGYAPASSLDGQAYGSTLFPGRWHSLRSGPAPRRVIYAASSRALAQLEKRVQANGAAPQRQALFALTLPAGLRIARSQDVGLPAHWRDDYATCQAFGDAWLDGGHALALWVPSYVEPAEDNLLINPAHPRAAELTLSIERDPFVFDPRLA